MLAEWLLPASTIALCVGLLALSESLREFRRGSSRVGWFFMGLAYAQLAGAWACLILFIIKLHVFNL